MNKLLNHVYVILFLYYTTGRLPEASDILSSMNIYFSGIGGVGIGPLAQIALDAGYTVQGSDVSVSSITEELQARGVIVSTDQSGAFLQSSFDESKVDWFVHTSALPTDHPELLLARRLGIKTAKRDELLAHIIKEKNLTLIAVAGTHGKTTTTGMAIWAMQQLDIPVSYSVGTTLSFGPSGTFVPGSKYFIYECDEFDRNFLHFNPHVSLITSIDYDHPDTFPTKAEYLGAFRQFVDQSTLSIMWRGDGLKINATADDGWILQDSDLIHSTLAGAHNRRNATLVAKLIEYLKVGEQSRILTVLDQFPGTNRRFEKLANNLYSDYGHHPVEIAATLQMARELSDHVVLVYQPHQNVRQHEIRDLYTDCFEQAEEIYWLPTYLSREDPSLAILSPQDLTQQITNKSAVYNAEMNNDLWNHIEAARSKGALVLAMGAGNIDTWLREQLRH